MARVANPPRDFRAFAALKVNSSNTLAPVNPHLRLCRGDALQKRRQLMLTWEQFVTGTAADDKVVPLHAV
jgi:hypothetical protein